MSPENSHSKSGKSRRGRSSRSSRKPTKFMPNLTQLQEAAKELPDPEIWIENNYMCPVEVEGRIHTVEFRTKTIARGSKDTRRWIYEGKVLIRKRDAKGD